MHEADVKMEVNKMDLNANVEGRDGGRQRPLFEIY